LHLVLFYLGVPIFMFQFIRELDLFLSLLRKMDESAKVEATGPIYWALEHSQLATNRAKVTRSDRRFGGPCSIGIFLAHAFVTATLILFIYRARAPSEVARAHHRWQQYLGPGVSKAYHVCCYVCNAIFIADMRSTFTDIDSMRAGTNEPLERLERFN
jgi:hypothetical protein